MSELKSAGHAEPSEYDVVSVRLSSGMGSLLCLLVSFGLTSLASYAHWWWARGYGRWVELGRWTAISAGILGIVLGVVAWREGRHRTIGLLGILGNGVVLLLLGLFIYRFGYILRR